MYKTNSRKYTTRLSISNKKGHFLKKARFEKLHILWHMEPPGTELRSKCQFRTLFILNPYSNPALPHKFPSNLFYIFFSIHLWKKIVILARPRARTKQPTKTLYICTTHGVGKKCNNNPDYLLNREKKMLINRKIIYYHLIFSPKQKIKIFSKRRTYFEPYRVLSRTSSSEQPKKNQ